MIRCRQMIHSYIYFLYMRTCNPNDPCFNWKRPSLGGKKDYSKMGSRYILPAPSSLGANEKPSGTVYQGTVYQYTFLSGTIQGHPNWKVQV